MKRVLILMSTYNGERYIREQIDSVLAQREVDVSLLIRDDGSCDDTVKIINDYIRKHRNIYLEEGVNCKSAKSFMELLRIAYSSYTTYDYYAFCDQDDIWKPEKLIEAVKVLYNKASSNPMLYIGSYQMVDSDLNEIDTQQKKPSINLPSAIVSNAATGCTMVFNKTLLEKVVSKSPDYIIMHDYWVYLVCLCYNGFIYYDEMPYILYRQHGDNVIGGKEEPFFNKWSVRLKKLFAAGEHYKSKLAESLLSCYGNEINEENRRFLLYVSTCNKWKSKFYLLKNPDFRSNSFDKNIQTWGLVLTGKF